MAYPSLEPFILASSYPNSSAKSDAQGGAMDPLANLALMLLTTCCLSAALLAFKDRLTAGQTAVSTWNMASGNPVRGEARPALPGVLTVAG